MSERCKNCCHWRPAETGDSWMIRWTGQGTCLAVRERWRVQEEATRGKNYSDFATEGDWDTWDDSPPPIGSFTWLQLEALKDAKATVQDGSDYRAELITSPDFGCVLFEAKP